MTQPKNTQATRVLLTESPYEAGETQKSWGRRGEWPCHWIACAEAGETPFVTAYRCRFTLDAAEIVRVHVTADERYILYLDGTAVGRGSERGDAENWFFETYDLEIDAGDHTIVAQVWSLGSMAPFAQMHVHHGLLLSPQERAHDSLVGTGYAHWTAKRLPGFSFTDPITAWGTGANVVIDGAAFDWGFERGEGESWQPVSVLKKGADWKFRNEIEREHLLRPAVLPAMLDRPRSLGRVRHMEEVDSQTTGDVAVRSENHRAMEAADWQNLVDHAAPLEIPPHTRRRVILDLDDYLCAYPKVTVSGGAGSLIRIHWQESLYTDPRRSVKGNRDEIEGKLFVAVWHLKDGVGDSFLPDGGAHRAFETLWWQCGRYIEVLIETQEQTLLLESLRLHETRYPLENESRFQADDARLEQIIPFAFRTLQMCAHEIYMDCPYFEQLMYIGDTRLQSLVTFVTTQDTRLPRKALELLGASQMHNGLTQSRYPTRVRQIIPPFSLWWIAMVYDYALWRGDRPFVHTQMPIVRGIVDHYLRLRNEAGLISGLKGWNAMDWVPEWPDGVPPDGYDGASGLLNWQFVWALELAARVESWLDEPEQAARDRRLSRTLAEASGRAFWSESRGLFADDARQTRFSEHTQCLALLSRLLPEEQAARVLDGLLTAPDLSCTTVYFAHYLFETLTQAGRTDVLLERLSLWHDLQARGLKTTVEMPEPTRSDCHAWGAHPLYHLLASILGMRPGGLGFTSVRIRPQLGPLKQASGRIAHPLGFIEVAVQRTEDSLQARVTLPAGLRGVFEHGPRSYPLRSGAQSVEFPDLQ